MTRSTTELPQHPLRQLLTPGIGPWQEGPEATQLCQRARPAKPPVAGEKLETETKVAPMRGD